MSIELLDAEMGFYEQEREKLIAQAEGQFVLIKDSEIAGTYKSQSDAISEGYRKYGNVPFLVKQILKLESPQNFVSNHFAL